MTNSSTSARGLREALRRLCGWESSEQPIVSAYLDLRPEVGNPTLRDHGEDPDALAAHVMSGAGDQ